MYSLNTGKEETGGRADGSIHSFIHSKHSFWTHLQGDRDGAGNWYVFTAPKREPFRCTEKEKAGMGMGMGVSLKVEDR